ncbi:MAG: peptidase inhibitor family I36 protein [Desulfobacteraceae bacterium]|nr:peptidase inhibitor family I36 protein [Desulfobacteraceae bacterium]
MSSYRIEKTPDRTDRESYNENYCIFYEHTNKKGAYFHGKAGGEPFVKDNWNDKISSVWVREGYTVTIYEHSNFSGRKKLLKGRKGGTLYNLTDIGFNDMISSYKAGINHKQLRELLKKNMPLK